MSGVVRLLFPATPLKADGSQYTYGYFKRPSVLFTVTPGGR
jgi:hypothetical protein